MSHRNKLCAPNLPKEEKSLDGSLQNEVQKENNMSPIHTLAFLYFNSLHVFHNVYKLVEQ